MKPHYFLKKYVPRLEIWGVLSVFMSFILVLAHANFATSEETNRFIVYLWLWVFFASSLMFSRNGLLSLLGINGFQDRDADVLNTFIDINGHVVKDISDEDLKTLFYYLKKENIIGAIKGFLYPFVGVPVPTALIMLSSGTSIGNALIILLFGVFAAVLCSSFILFFSENFFAKTLKECREEMKRRGLETDENIYLVSLKGKFNYFVFLALLAILVTLSFVAKISPFLLITISIAFILIMIISRLLFSSIYMVFEGMKDFIKKLARGERAEYFPGTSCNEELDLSHGLNKSAEELYERGEEINKWYKLTVGRELRMVELKDEIKELKLKVKEFEEKNKRAKN